MTFYLLHVPKRERELLGQAVLELDQGTIVCRRCFNIADPSTKTGQEGFCEICADGGRNQQVICVVEDPLDLLALEKTGKYQGLYHVLHGVIAPLEHVGPEDLKIDELIERLRRSLGGQRPKVEELILATNPSLEGEATAMYLKKLISNKKGELGEIRVTRIARGVPTGGDLEYADEVTLTKALEGRQEY